MKHHINNRIKFKKNRYKEKDQKNIKKIKIKTKKDIFNRKMINKKNKINHMEICLKTKLHNIVNNQINFKNKIYKIMIEKGEIGNNFIVVKSPNNLKQF
jgi:hypothetical protein